MTIAVFDPAQAIMLPSSNAALLSRRNSRPVLSYSPGFDESGIFEGALPLSYSGTGINARVIWGQVGSAVGNLKLDLAFERLQAGVTDLDTNNFAAPQSSIAAGPAGPTPFYTTIPFTNSQIAGLIAGDAYRLLVTRNGTDPSDTLADQAQILRIILEDAALASSKWHVDLQMRAFAQSDIAPSTQANFAEMAFQSTGDDVARWTLYCPSTYGGGNLRVRFVWNCAVDTDSVKWDAAFGKVENGDTATTTFAAYQSATEVVPATAATMRITTINFTNAQADALAPGGYFQFRMHRDNTIGDNAAGDANLLGLAIEEV